MAVAKDLTGQRFGRLVLLSLDPEPYTSPSGKKTRRWICRCDCGTELSVLQNALTGKTGTRSCGCVRNEKTRRNGHDLTGKRFGRLVVLRETELDTPGANGLRRAWLCQCDCGKKVIRTQKDLELTGIQSCGCLLSETARDKIVVQNTVGHFDGTTVSAIRPDRPANKNSKSGVKGVYWSEREQIWIARIGVRGKEIKIGRFHSLEAARKARQDAEETYFTPIIEAYDEEDR